MVQVMPTTILSCLLLRNNYHCHQTKCILPGGSCHVILAGCGLNDKLSHHTYNYTSLYRAKTKRAAFFVSTNRKSIHNRTTCPRGTRRSTTTTRRGTSYHYGQRQEEAKTSSEPLLHHKINRKKQILQPHHAHDIIHDYKLQCDEYSKKDDNSTKTHHHHLNHNMLFLFSDFVKTVCSTSTIPRKELYETWSTALIIQQHFPHVKRIADIACGHGLLSWSLLLLDHYNHNSHLNGECRRTAVCIDRRMPKSADKIAHAMITKWPELETMWDYVESKLDNISIQPPPSSSSSSPYDSSTLICAIHACGTLSDQIISLAIQGNTPLALMPCCHSKKSLNEQQRIVYNNRNMLVSSSSSSSSLSEYIDNLRVTKLESSHYQVTQTFISKEYTPQNKVILATPSIPISTSSSSNNINDNNNNNNNNNTEISNNNVDINNLSPLLFFERTKFHHQQKQEQQLKQQKQSLKQQHPMIPIGNDVESIQTVKKLSGRIAAEKRKIPSPPSLCVSMYMSKSNAVTPDMLLNAAGTIWNSNQIQVHIDYADDGPYLHPNNNGLLARTFRITYLNLLQGNKRSTSTMIGDDTMCKQRAKQLHDEFCTKIVKLIDDIHIRR